MPVEATELAAHHGRAASSVETSATRPDTRQAPLTDLRDDTVKVFSSEFLPCRARMRGWREWPGHQGDQVRVLAADR